MSAIEGMVRTILSALDIDVEKLKEEVTGRIKNFETNLETLNATLIALHKSNKRIEAKLDAICEYHNIRVTLPTANDTELVNERVDERKPVPQIAR